MWFTSLARLAGAVIVSVPLGVTMILSYQFGTETFGNGNPVYGVLYASFAAAAAVCTFSALSATDRSVRIAAAILSLLCMGCSGAGSLLSLGAKQDQIRREEASRADLAGEIAAVRQELAGVRARDRATVEAEQKMRADRYETARVALRRASGKVWKASDEDEARDLELINEIAADRRADGLRARLAALEAREAPAGKARSGAVIEWAAGKVGLSVETAGYSIMVAFVLTTEMLNGLGLFVVLGGHRLVVTAGEAKSEAIVAPEPAESEAAPVVRPVQSWPIAVVETASDPVEAFLSTMVVADQDAVTPFSDIEAAWLRFCSDRGIDGTAVNLGFALKRCGYASAKVPGTRRMGRKGLRIAA